MGFSVILTRQQFLNLVLLYRDAELLGFLVLERNHISQLLG